MKTDFHCHILPGLDDGAQNIEEALYLCRKLVEWGYTDAVCVAHSSYRYRNTPQTVIRACALLNDALQEKSINLSLHPSMEYRIIPEVWAEVQENKWWLPWYGNHILVEFPIRSREFFGDLDPFEEVKKVLDDGYQPVLAHPERYHYMNMEELARLHDLGCEFQMNLGSLYGFYDEETKRRAELIDREGLLAYTGTDIHNKKYADFYDDALRDAAIYRYLCETQPEGLEMVSEEEKNAFEKKYGL